MNSEKTNTFTYLCVMKRVNFNTTIPQEMRPDYQDKYIVLLDNVHHVQHTQETLLNETFIIMLVEEGECCPIINEKEYHLNKGDILICTPGNIIERGMVSFNHYSRIFVISSEQVGDLLKGTHMSISHYLMSKVVRVLHLTPEEQNVIKEFYRIISAMDPLPNDNAKDMAIQHLLQSMSYTFAGLFLNRGFAQRNDKATSAEALFRNFIRLLKDHPDGRTVQFFASKLNITPKYFNTICKQVSGKTASTLINEEIVNLAQIMLKDHDLSIKQISSILGFANQSHFGSFIRREVGISPQALRRKQSL